MALTLQDNAGKSRYELYSDDDLAAFVEYHRYRDEIAFTHTETEPAFRGRGVAAQLVRQALDDVRPRGLKVLPYCPYVRGFIVRNPEYLDLVPPSDHERFGLAAAQS